MLKNKLIIFGGGFYGKNAYKKYKLTNKIICIADNNADRIEENQFDVPLIFGSDIAKYYCEDVDVIVCSKYYAAICVQLHENGIHSFYIMLEGFLYHSDINEIMTPIELNDSEKYRKLDSKKSILFLQNAACIRTHKIAKAMREAGWHVFLAYTLVPPINEYGEYKDIYEKIWGFTSANGIKKFIDDSDFDIVHCSNEPDILVTIAQKASKPVVFDTHDMQSIRSRIDSDSLFLEYIANTFSNGNIYTSEGVKKIAEEKYDLSNHDVLVLENMVYDQVEVDTVKEKLSTLDGEIHCVYEGGIVGTDKSNHRYFEEIWLKIAEQGVHIHFYSQQDYTYCKELEAKSPFFHYEGNIGGTELIIEMTRYDMGLLLFNVNNQNRLHLEMATANKMYEYLNSRLPIVVGDVSSHIDFVSKYGVGTYLDMGKDIKEQLLKTQKIIVPYNFIRNNSMTVKSMIKQIENFYCNVINSYEVLKL